jgi:hypothetical protein
LRRFFIVAGDTAHGRHDERQFRQVGSGAPYPLLLARDRARRETGYAVVEERFTNGGLELRRQRLRTRIAALPRAVAAAVSPNFAARWLGGFSLLVLATAG